MCIRDSIKQVLMVEPYQSFISLVETIGHIYRKVNKLNVNFSGLNTVRRNKEPISIYCENGDIARERMM